MKVAGPFSSEPGFELLYWLPYLRSINGRAYDASVTRGGAGIWYQGQAIDAYDEIGFENYRDLSEQRYELSRVEKSFGPDDLLDREILRTIEAESAVHPSEMYQRLDVAHTWPFEPLEKPEQIKESGYIAVRFYTSFQMPQNALIGQIVGKAAEKGRVVALVPQEQIDNHGEHRIPKGDNISLVTYTPEDSLQVISQVVAHADAFLCTYGGLSYLGPHYGVPTRAFHMRQPNDVHRAQERRMVKQLNGDYELVRI